MDGGIYDVNLESGEHALIGGHESYASGVAHLKQTDILVSAGYDGVLQWHDPKSRKLIRKASAHNFWSWQMAASPDEKLVASVTGQYLSGGYKYEPAAERELSVRLFEAQTGKLLASFSHVPPVMSVAFSPDSNFLAAGNLMGEIRIWEVASGRMISSWTTPSFTSWGIIKSHCYIGGIFGLAFSPDGQRLLACGMGPMRDPMAGNGKQTWERFNWRDGKKLDAIRESEFGHGLMETIVFTPGGERFVMAGRLAQGKWNVAFFNAKDGALVHALDSKMRVTKAVFHDNGKKLLLSAAVSQSRKEGKFPDFGRIVVYSVG
jgi:WD40 repeat protein